MVLGWLTLVILTLAWKSVTLYSIIEPPFKAASNFPDLSISSSRARRSLAADESCGQSLIRENSTLKGGIQAGYFRKLAQYVAMQLCVELCCEEKGCDVAFMTGKNCYGVQCFSEEMCQAVPVRHKAPETILISHVTIQGEGANEASGNHPTNLKCLATRMKVGVTLKGGLRAGNFTDVGKIDSMPLCAKLCCVSEKCDLALMISSNCFLVSCYSHELCKAVKARSIAYKPSIAYVMRRTGQAKNDTVNKLSVLHTTPNKLLCKNSNLFHNATFLGGYRAGNYTDLGKVADMSACTRLCCGDKRCDAAFMLERNCYAVDCQSEELCTPVKAKRSSALGELDPKISYITSRSEEVDTKPTVSQNGSCRAGAISYDVTLRGGIHAGNFTPHGSVPDIEACISRCCDQEGCNVAMMLKNDCFTVQCSREELCEKKPSRTSSKFSPKLAYVIREQKNGGKSPHLMVGRLAHNKPTPSLARDWSIADKLGFYGNLTIVNKTGVSHNLTAEDNDDLSRAFGIQGNHSTSNRSQSTASGLINSTAGAVLKTDSQMSANNTENKSKAVGIVAIHGQNLSVSAIEASNNNSTNGSTVSKGAKFKSGLASSLRFMEDDPGCTNSETLYNMTLRGGITSGRFKDRGKTDHFDQCIKICCYSSTCDLAFMLKQQCFSVECRNEEMCQAIPARSSQLAPHMSYIYARLKPVAKRSVVYDLLQKDRRPIDYIRNRMILKRATAIEKQEAKKAMINS